MRYVWGFCIVAVIVGILLAPVGVSAHEVYVLSPDTIATDLAAPSSNPFEAFHTNQLQFFLWGFIVFVIVSTIFFSSITHWLEFLFEPYLIRLRPWAAPVARVTLGLCLIASAYNNALFGPELPLGGFGAWALLVQLALYAAGAALLFNIQARIAALSALAIFAGGIALHGWYMLTYTNYLGEILLALFVLKRSFEPYAFLVLRVGFGVSVAVAAIYAKFLHSNLALSVVQQYSLTQFFHFDPLFIVLGACIIEVLMGIFFIIGFELRHTALFFLFWIFLSLLYFGESVWPHMVLVGVNISLFMYGYDKWTVEGRLFNRGKFQPFL